MGQYTIHIQEAKGGQMTLVWEQRPISTGLGGRLIIFHVGTASGFVCNTLLFKSIKTESYCEEMVQATVA